MAKKQSIRSRNFRRSDPAYDLDSSTAIENETKLSVKEKVAKEIANIALRSGGSESNGISKKKKNKKQTSKKAKDKLAAALKAQAREERLDTKISKSLQKQEKLKARKQGDE
ncbi:Shuttling pre-60S factor C23B6.02c [Schizosaccharomyces pombe]|uniref:Shuttling pre-60S factor C23B6.02c n=1 Tax=Schizosaccharomyces pombe (strain 972 / ATCC 24843) TaxID=284812 RepID=ECM1_SCHPO|nr:putative pre-ribosomal factor [Schizosaccharomyces pombe]Q9UUA0.2 RecName: Full=Shuttling pre-60S factor C23B6.02c [Schizosaccharomyces pombe 972h-]CAB51561.2 pre-ribosomal factor (predicted) [Schizosaccharomyces pombe]|eukprot:NP_588125.2 putative pre-ribosomal factor [Schizosaccharomyces pombe]